MKALAFDPEKCIGCDLCRLACSGHNEKIFNPRLARLYISHRYDREGLKVSGRVCNLCLACVEACPEEAIRLRNSRLTFDLEACTDCGLCAEACPNQVIVVKDRGMGICVQCRTCANWCPTGALTFEEVNS